MGCEIIDWERADGFGEACMSGGWREGNGDGWHEAKTLVRA